MANNKTAPTLVLYRPLVPLERFLPNLFTQEPQKPMHIQPEHNHPITGDVQLPKITHFSMHSGTTTHNVAAERQFNILIQALQLHDILHNCIQIN